MTLQEKRNSRKDKIELEIVTVKYGNRLSMVLRTIKHKRVVERIYILDNSTSKTDARNQLYAIAKRDQYKVYDGQMDNFNGGYWEY
jgi:hypothetical protein